MDFLKNIVGGNPAKAPSPADDSDFAEFAGAPAPQPVSIPASPADAQGAVPTSPYSYTGAPVVYTKWYRVWERTTLADFQIEMYIVPLVLVALLVHVFGVKRNKRKANKWMAVHTPILNSEFALVGLSNQPKLTTSESAQSLNLLETSAKLGPESVGSDIVREKSAYEFETYASGRLNVAFADFRVQLWKWYNPFMLIAEQLTGVFIESLKAKPESMDAVIYTFDGNEKDYVAPAVPGSDEIGSNKAIPNSSYDQFIFAIVHKMSMRKLREERYDLSLTFTRDHAKLPNWVSVMSEAAEISDTLITKDLVAAIEKLEDTFEYLIVTDQPIEKPATLDEAEPKKRLHLCLRLPSDDNYLPSLPLFQAFLRLPDALASSAKFRPEIVKKIAGTREAEKSKLKKVKEQEIEEERKALADKSKKEERDRKMKGLSAEEQRKFLEREAAKDRKKQEKKMSRKG